MNKYYSMVVKGNEADIYIFGDIVTNTEQTWCGIEADVSSYSLVKELMKLSDDITAINVHINSYGGYVSEGFAIYNALKEKCKKATVRTYCDGFACSAASVIFMAGTERIMYDASALFIHGTITCASGSAEDLLAEAELLKQFTEASAAAYLACINIPKEQLMQMLKDETWIFPQDALKMGFCTEVRSEAKDGKPQQSAKASILASLRAGAKVPEVPPKMAETPPAAIPPAPEATIADFLNALAGRKDLK